MDGLNKLRTIEMMSNHINAGSNIYSKYIDKMFHYLKIKEQNEEEYYNTVYTPPKISLHIINKKPEDIKPDSLYVDGSYGINGKISGFGGVYTISDNCMLAYYGHTDLKNLCGMRNVSGEILGTLVGIALAKYITPEIIESLDESYTAPEDTDFYCPKVDLYYDYYGIEYWAIGKWKRNKEETKKYYKLMKNIMDDIIVTFHKVEGHSGVLGNEMADRLSKVGAYILHVTDIENFIFAKKSDDNDKKEGENECE